MAAMADDNPYGVQAPKAETLKTDTAKTVKVPPVAADTSSKAAVKTGVKKDSVAVKPLFKKAIAKAKADSIKVVQDSLAAVKKNAKADSSASIKADSVKTSTTTPVEKVDTTASTTAADTTAKKPRQRIVRETTINSINEGKGSYRSPKRALFMSLVIPGLGQAYIGQSAFTYARAATYFATDVVLGLFWYQYVVVKHDREVNHYHQFADTYWSQRKYEDSITQQSNSKNFLDLNPARDTYCNAVTASGSELQTGCKDPILPQYSGAFLSEVHGHDYPNSPDSTAAYRATFPNTFDFYSIIGQEQEFLAGWADANVVYGDSAILGTSVQRDQYVSMRAQANRYARMQAWFLGGIVLNHIASALDAALTARYHNKQLYETQSASWYDHLHFDGGLTMDQGWPKTNLTASLTF